MNSAALTAPAQYSQALSLRSQINNLAAELRRQQDAGYSTAETRRIRAEIVQLEGQLSGV